MRMSISLLIYDKWIYCGNFVINQIVIQVYGGFSAACSPYITLKVFTLYFPAQGSQLWCPGLKSNRRGSALRKRCWKLIFAIELHGLVPETKRKSKFELHAPATISTRCGFICHTTSPIPVLTWWLKHHRSWRHVTDNFWRNTQVIIT